MSAGKSFRAYGLSALLGVLFLGGCLLVRNQTLEVQEVARTPRVVDSPVKAHLLDGSIVVFQGGIQIVGDTVRSRTVNPGMRYNVLMTDSTPVRAVLLDSVGGLETYQLRTNTGTSMVMTVLASTAATIGTVALWTAIFGSCPTVYSDSAGVQVLDAEIFANRISPLFEARDIDLLGARADARGTVTLDVRNEALETHYLNVLELLEVRHRPDERVIPDERGKPIAVARTLLSPTSARDSGNRDVIGVLAETDGRSFETDHAALESLDDIYEEIDLVFPRPEGVQEVALTMRLRNSVLNSVLLYDVIMGAQGVRALDWLSVDMKRIGAVIEFGRWHNSRFGLRVSVRENGEFKPVVRHPNYGPIAWREVATMVPVPQDDSLRIRLHFVKDDWRIDRASLVVRARRVPVRRVPITEVVETDATLHAEAVSTLRQPDDRYLVTTPGQRFSARFDAGTERPGEARTFLLASHGFYTEWIRGSWIRNAHSTAAFTPGDHAIREALTKWKSTRDAVEHRFFATRIPAP